MDNLNLFKIAYEFLKKNNFNGIYLVKDIGDSLVFYGGNPDETYYGIRTISVNKENQNVEWFDSNVNRNILNDYKEIDIPNEYRYKAY